MLLCSVHHFILLISTPSVLYFENDELCFLFETFGRSFLSCFFFFSLCLFVMLRLNPSLYARLLPHFEGQGLLPPRDLNCDTAPDLLQFFWLMGKSPESMNSICQDLHPLMENRWAGRRHYQHMTCWPHFSTCQLLRFQGNGLKNMDHNINLMFLCSVHHFLLPYRILRTMNYVSFLKHLAGHILYCF